MKNIYDDWLNFRKKCFSNDHPRDQLDALHLAFASGAYVVFCGILDNIGKLSMEESAKETIQLRESIMEELKKHLPEFRQ